MAGYSMAAYDIRSLSNVITTKTDRIGDQLLRASDVGSTDLGDGVGAAYLEVVHGTVADSLAAFQSAGERLSELLAATVEHYEELDREGSARFNRLREDLT